MDKHGISILYAENERQLPPELWHRYMEKVPVRIRDSIMRYVRWQDRHAHLIGNLLLLENLKHFGYEPDLLFHIQYSEYGKPYINSTVYFNISHSGEYVICAASKDCGPLGIDIEKIKPVDLLDFSPVFGRQLITDILNSKDPMRQFFHMWTAFESAIKADGRGLSISPETLKMVGEEIKVAESKWFLEYIDIDPHYICHLSSQIQNPQVEISKCNFI